ncbi:cellulose binding domain-containing protein [Actinoplanes sp. NPDC026619]|uniref:cellulose binding domain-containing protein n=1 Tax=Actinoplanes sp. NPDC026619 TaxID=3155798 RepID=UPI00340C8068
MTRRSPSVVLLDAMLGLATAVQNANLPGSGSKSGSGKPRSRAAIVWLVAGVLVAAGITALVVGAVLRTPDHLADLPPGGVVAAPATSTPAAATPATTKPSATPTTPATSAPRTSRTPEKTVTASVPPLAGKAHLAAAYATPGGLLGYRANVTVTSDGSATADGWTLTVTMPRSTLQLSAVSGATVEQNGTVWTFTPTDDTRRIPAGSSAVVVFDVLGATLIDAKPTACQIGGESCTGLN